MDAKQEIEGILERRPADHETLWPMDMDGCYGNPTDICETCGHQRQVHGVPDGEDLGVGECNAMTGGNDMIPPDLGAKALTSLLPASFHDSLMIRVGASVCECKAFKGPKPVSKLARHLNNPVD